MSHICYLFEGLTFSLWFGAFAPCRSGIDFTMPPKVAVRRIAIGRCVANCRKYALSPRPRGRFSPVGNENRGHPTTASYLCIGKSSLNAKEWLARTSATLRSSLWYEKEASHIRPSVIPMSRSSVCGLSADSEIAQAIWLSMDGTFASHQPM